MSMWSRTLVYLGLREEPDDVVGDWQVVDEEPEAAEPRRTAPVAAATAAPAASAARRPEVASSNVRPLRSSVDIAGERVSVVQVRVFDDVEAIGSRYRQRQPVLFDVSGCSREIGRRAVDFVSGLTYASHGSLRRAAPRAFLVVPDGVDIPLDERRRLSQLGYDVEGSAR